MVLPNCLLLGFSPLINADYCTSNYELVNYYGHKLLPICERFSLALIFEVPIIVITHGK